MRTGRFAIAVAAVTLSEGVLDHKGTDHGAVTARQGPDGIERFAVTQRVPPLANRYDIRATVHSLPD
jgi:hypothetical protein